MLIIMNTKLEIGLSLTLIIVDELSEHKLIYSRLFFVVLVLYWCAMVASIHHLLLFH